MKSFQGRGFGFSSQWPRNTRAKKTREVDRGEEHRRRTLAHATARPRYRLACQSSRGGARGRRARPGSSRARALAGRRPPASSRRLEATEQVGPRRVEEVVVVEIAGEPLDQWQSGRRSVGHRHRHGPVQLDHGARRGGGEGAVEARDLGPVGVLGTRRPRVERRDRRLQLVGTGRMLVERPSSTARPSSIISWSHRARSWSSSNTRSPRGVGAGPSPGVLQQHQGEQPCTSGSTRQQSVDHARHPDRLVAQVDPNEGVAARCAVALVEHEVEHREHARRVVPRGARAEARGRGCPASRIFRFARTSRWATVGSGDRNARAISFVERPPTVRRVRATASRPSGAPGDSR